MDDYRALIEELHALRAPFSYSQSLGGRAARAVEALVAERDAANAKLEAVRKYADERAWYARRNTTVDSVRIASDLFDILGLGPDGKAKP